ncbi:5-formyltetrahydrofolate cyclo-ligase [Pseudidiomarina piscicola]|uniref:5-formyltetrahydrofolate cyclo-ligase n=1 Tax=Pseudidiomarina piscicola TaxID=2614830 RepID=A0A6S6WVU4_9GAMM|nr:5-formyltetrahydrofolate cyclo-ligase [Pseudidiomarina piscicola]CAB0151891.1 5-formyltetrahydrofolate cyclo-ligase [Pseudidiomarina piscicola]VZT41337.1 5-formyltetrahydrofolate cyclo-ligase [Pseudomonas aeruginosa]
MDRQQLRKHLLKQRQALTSQQRNHGAAQVLAHLSQLPELQRPRRLASYHSVRAELPTAAINTSLQQQGHQLALPVLHPVNTNHLLFLHVHAGTCWQNNSYGIPEPRLACTDIVPLAELTLLLVPLVGFDNNGNRMGMGGGFYDRTLAAWHAGQLPHLHPIGLAFDCQHVERLPNEAWDVPLPRVITPAKIWDFRS